MNANKIAADVVAMVAPESMGGGRLTVSVRENVIAVSLVRDSQDRRAFENYNETLDRMHDALKALKVAPGNFRWRSGRGCEIGPYTNRRELYTTTLEIL